MQKNFSISAFFPCYNDGGTIASMITLMDLSLREITEDYEIIVIDDGSSDHSRAILKELQTRYPSVRVILHDQNQGYGGALKSGFSSATAGDNIRNEHRSITRSGMRLFINAPLVVYLRPEIHRA